MSSCSFNNRAECPWKYAKGASRPQILHSWASATTYYFQSLASSEEGRKRGVAQYHQISKAMQGRYFKGGDFQGRLQKKEWPVTDLGLSLALTPPFWDCHKSAVLCTLLQASEVVLKSISFFYPEKFEEQDGRKGDSAKFQNVTL